MRRAVVASIASSELVLGLTSRLLADTHVRLPIGLIPNATPSRIDRLDKDDALLIAWIPSRIFHGSKILAQRQRLSTGSGNVAFEAVKSLGLLLRSEFSR